MSPFIAWVETTRLATTVKDSLLLTAGLSAVHLLGFTLVTGGALVANLRLLGVLLPGRPIVEVTTPAARGIALGLVVSVTTGLLLFGPRASAASANGTFRLKMLFLVAAALFHFTVHARVTKRAPQSKFVLRTTGTVGLLLWFAVAAAGCAFILLE